MAVVVAVAALAVAVAVAAAADSVLILLRTAGVLVVLVDDLAEALLG